MKNLVQFIVLGISSGAIYVALALGLLIIYRATALLNFAQGAMAMWGAYVYVYLRTTGTLILPIGHINMGSSSTSWWLALILGLVMGLLLSLLAQVLVFRPLRNAPPLAQVVASIALMIMLLALVQIHFNANAVPVPAILTKSSWTVAGASLNESALILFGISILLGVGVWAYFSYTTSGMAMRAASVNERAIGLMGYSPSVLSVVAWSISAVLSTGIVILASPATSLDPVNFTFYVIPALAVLLVARLTSVAGVVIAGLVLGSFQSVITYASSLSWWPTWGQVGLQDAIPFVVIVITLFIWGSRLPARGSLGADVLPRVRLPSIRPVNLAAPLVISLVLLLVTHGKYRYGVITSLIITLITLSYVLITGYLGQISLAQIAFAGAAGFILSKLTTDWHVPFPVSLLLSALGAGALGLLVAVPAFRIRGTQLAIVTIAAALTIEQFVFSNPSLNSTAGNPVGEPYFLGLNLSVQRGHDIATLAFGLTTLIIVVLFGALFIVLARGETGRTWLAVRSNERAAAAAGVNVKAVKLTGFGISAVIAGVGGAMIGYSQGALTASSFTTSIGLLFLAATYVGGITSLNGALVAGALCNLGIVYALINSQINFGKWYGLVAGVGLVLTTVLNPVGIVGVTYGQYEWVMKKLGRDPDAASGGSGSAPTPPSAKEPEYAS